MGGCRCSYKECLNTTRSSENIHFFHFPVKNRQRCMKWIENCEKPTYYDLEEEQLKNKVVCHKHFEDRWFPNHQNKRLIAGAVPTLDRPMVISRRLLSDQEKHNKSEREYQTNQYKDVQVLPANDDKTVFYLNAENMFTESPKIESYVIRNGALVPSSSNTKPVPKQPRTKAHMGTFQCYQNHFKSRIDSEENREEPPPKVIKREPVRELLKEVPVKKEVVDPNDSLSTHKKEPVHIAEDYKDIDSIEVHNQTESSHDVKSVATSHLEKTYLKKIKQHSKEIATIKRLLSQTKVGEKPDISTSLSVLEEKLPTTIMTVISLILGLKNDLNEEDVEFFTTLHKTSAEAYQLLSVKYGWNLPSVDVVETDE